MRCEDEPPRIQIHSVLWLYEPEPKSGDSMVPTASSARLILPPHSKEKKQQTLIIIKKARFYIAQYPVHWTAQSTLHFAHPPPRRPVHSRHQLNFSGKHSRRIIMRNDYSLPFPPLSIARYSFIQLSELGRRGENETAPSGNGKLLNKQL